MAMLYYESSFAHHGIKGQKWGVRRFQNPDGTLTKRGRKRYGDPTNDPDYVDRKERNSKLVDASPRLDTVNLHSTEAEDVAMEAVPTGISKLQTLGYKLNNKEYSEFSSLIQDTIDTVDRASEMYSEYTKVPKDGLMSIRDWSKSSREHSRWFMEESYVAKEASRLDDKFGDVTKGEFEKKYQETLSSAKKYTEWNFDTWNKGMQTKSDSLKRKYMTNDLEAQIKRDSDKVVTMGNEIYSFIEKHDLYDHKR